MDKSKFTIALLARSVNRYITGGSRRRIEIVNRLAHRGWNVTMYTFDNLPISSRWKPMKLEVPLKKRTGEIEADFVICGDIFEDPLETKQGTFLTAKAKIKKIWLMQLYRPVQGPILKDKQIMKVAVSTHMVKLLREKCNQEAYPAIGGVDTAFFLPQPETKDFVVLTYKMKSKIERAGELIGFQERDGKQIQIGLKMIDGSQTQAELRQRYWNCKVFVSLEYADFYGWCNPIAEAMACGRACVAVDSPHVRDLIIDGETGLLAKPDVDDIRNKINRLSDKRVRRRLVENGIQHIKQFDWERVVDNLEEFLL